MKNELYTCTYGGSCQYSFKTTAKKLKSSTSNCSEHIELKHHHTKEIEAAKEREQNPTAIEKWARVVGDNPTFEEALLDWIVMDSQAFTIVEEDNFKRMIHAIGFSGKLISTNTIANRLQD